MTEPAHVRRQRRAARRLTQLASRAPVEPKVRAATGGAAAGAVITAFALWLLDQVWWNGDAAPDVPMPVVGLVGLVVSGACAFVSGYYARHVNRP